MDGGKRGVVEDRGGVIKRRRLLQGGRGAGCTAGAHMLGREGTKGLVGCMVLSGECICTICI